MIGVLLVASLAWAAVRTSGALAAAYFDTFARAWKLLAGAALAVLGTAPRRLGESGRRVVAGVGLALIVIGSVMVGPQWPVPFPWVGPAVLGTAVVIWADASAGPRSVLGNRVAQWLGQMSYSLYLWHFPVVVFAESVFGRSRLVGAACLPVMLGLAELSRRYVEQPALHGRFLSQSARALNPRRFVGRDLVLGASVLALVAGLSAGQLSGPEPLRSADSIARLAGVPHFAGDRELPSADQRTQQIRAALAASAWPEPTRMQLDRLFSLQGPEAMLAKAPGCRNSVLQTSPTLICGEPDDAGGPAGGGTSQGGAGPGEGAGPSDESGQGSEALVVGDSVALSWVPAVQTAARLTGWRLRAVGFANCPLVDVPVSNWARDPAFAQGCAARRAELIALIGERRPAVVILSSAQGAMVSSRLELGAAAEAWQAGLERTLAAVAALPEPPRVVVLSNPPVVVHPLTCSNRLSSPASCISEVGADYAAKASAERAAVAKFSNACFVDTASWLCEDGRCPAFIGDQIVRLDGVHLTEAAARAVGTMLIDSASSRG